MGQIPQNWMVNTFTKSTNCSKCKLPNVPGRGQNCQARVLKIHIHVV